MYIGALQSRIFNLFTIEIFFIKLSIVFGKLRINVIFFTENHSIRDKSLLRDNLSFIIIESSDIYYND